MDRGCDLPPDLGKSPTDYLEQLFQNLEVAKHYADIHTQKAQQTYVNRYNTRSKDKHFQPGEMVLILQPDSTTSRLFARWKGPAEVVEVRSPYSYVVELNGTRYRLHANQLRRFHVKVDEVRVDTVGFGVPNSVTDDYETESESDGLSCGDGLYIQNDDVDDPVVTVSTCAIIRDEDSDFGSIQTCNSVQSASSGLLPSQRIDPSFLSHLSESENNQLLAILDRYPDVFRDEPGLYTGVCHTIPLSPDFKPKRLKEYKIPELIKPEVRRQIKDLLDQGIISESNSPMASPLVCILKGPGGRDGIRLATDLRYLNRYTISDAFPIPDKVGTTDFTAAGMNSY